METQHIRLLQQVGGRAYLFLFQCCAIDSCMKFWNAGSSRLSSVTAGQKDAAFKVFTVGNESELHTYTHARTKKEKPHFKISFAFSEQGLARDPKLAWNPWSSCLSLSNVEVRGT